MYGTLSHIGYQCSCSRSNDICSGILLLIQGYPYDFNERVWSGFLSTSSANRKLHYLFVESASKSSNTPVILWLNGGPGCSSLIGFLQEIGPYYLQEGINYQPGDKLTPNPHSWHKIAHLLFIESPAGVGYSINNETNFNHTDLTTLLDNTNALIDFYAKFPEYKSNGLWLAGESYAGKYIPDLALQIDNRNAMGDTKINLKGIMVGNGVMSFIDNQLQRTAIDYMIDHHFIDPEAVSIYQKYCKVNLDSDECHSFFNIYY